MFGLTREDADGVLEDIAKINAAAAEGRAERIKRDRQVAARNLSEANATIYELLEVLDLGSAKVAEQKEFISRLQSELQTARERAIELERSLATSRERHAEHVAVANATASTLAEAVSQLSGYSDEPQMVEEKYRVIRTRAYNNQVTDMLAKGHLSIDPRTTPVISKRTWYIPGLDGDVSSKP